MYRPSSDAACRRLRRGSRESLKVRNLLWARMDPLWDQVGPLTDLVTRQVELEADLRGWLTSQWGLI